MFKIRGRGDSNGQGELLVPRQCSSRIYDILPVIDDNSEYDENEAYDCNTLHEKLQVPKDYSLADFYIHYSSCKYIVIEEGKKNKTVEKATDQIKNTIKLLREKNMPIDFIALVSDQLTTYDRKNYVCNNNFLLIRVIGRVRPVEIEGIRLRCFRKAEVQKRRKNGRIDGYL